MTKIKICGLRRPEDAAYANSCRPDYAGFVFADSKRQIDGETAKRLREALDPRIETVGVFLNQPVEFVAELFRQGVIGLIQLHGDEDEEYRERLHALIPVRIIQAVGVGEALPILPTGPDYLLFDKASPRRGGSGRAFDWRVLEQYEGGPFFLAGGLGLENVEAAIRLLRPYCVDVSTGVETDGRKDNGQMEAFVNLVRRMH